MLKTPLIGGSNVSSWDECGKNRIIRILVGTNSHRITSIQFGYVEESDSAVFSDRHGGGRNNFKMVNINYPAEYLTTVSGRYVCYNNGLMHIDQLSFGTNKQKYGPFGCEIANDDSSTKKYSFSIEMDKDFYGFYGYSGHLAICGIGVYLKPDACVFSSSAQINMRKKTWKNMLKMPLIGGSDGNGWDECGRNRITRIFVGTNSRRITSIQFGYVEESDSAVFSDSRGGGGNNFKMVKIDYPSEYLTTVSGRYVCYNNGLTHIDQLSFGTNKQKYGPFGCEIATGNSFSIEMDKDFYGFYGYSGHLAICGIGVYLKPDACVFSSSAQINMRKKTWKKMPLIGGSDGNGWDECGRNRITRIFVGSNSEGPTLIQFGFIEESDSTVFSDRHGGGGDDFKMVKIDYPSEYLTSVSGSYVGNTGCERIYQLSFGTNKQKYGPFGSEILDDNSSTQSSFSIEMDKDFYGFHGYSNCLGICGIGVYLQPDACVFRSSAQITSAVSDFDDDPNSSDFIKKEVY